jgi:hypothetical protein
MAGTSVPAIPILETKTPGVLPGVLSLASAA